MLISRRPPWWGSRSSVTDPNSHTVLDSASLMCCVIGSGAMLFPRLDLYQKWGYAHDLLNSHHVEFAVEEWQQGVLGALWVEVILTDERVALRQMTSTLTCEQARLRRANEELVQVYVPVWRCDHLTSLGSLEGL